MKQTKKEPLLKLFFALWPNESERAALAAWQAPLRELCGGREMAPVTLHATVVFLGDVAEHRLESLYLAAQEAEFRPFDLHLTTAHYWGHNHIVYAAPAVVPPPLAQLVGELEASLRRHRFRFESRPYKPHITLLRHAKWSDEPLPAMPQVLWRARGFALVRSLSDEQGARYEVLARFGTQALE